MLTISKIENTFRVSIELQKYKCIKLCENGKFYDRSILKNDRTVLFTGRKNKNTALLTTIFGWFNEQSKYTSESGATN